jgi:hypothetical protein
MMRALLLIAVLGFILLAVGVLHYRSNQNEVTVTIDKQKGREDRACNREGQRTRIGNRRASQRDIREVRRFGAADSCP